MFCSGLPLLCLMEKYKGYLIAESDKRGGKAGRGHNVTATIQVREPLQGGDYLLRKQIRYTVGNAESKAKALEKAKTFIDTL